jgi:hypothetical protein
MKRLASLALACTGMASLAWSQQPPAPLAKGIQDNSFLIEEAYNQEPGVVQHIGSFRRQGDDRFFAFTQELPLGSQAHQFSWSVPYAWVRDELVGDIGRLGAVQLNYRYQALAESAHLPAFAPRLSLVLPIDDPKSELGEGGLQINLPFSKVVADRVTVHFNAGATTFFDVQGRQPTSYNLGGSVVYALSRETNLLFETVAEWIESVEPARDIKREFALILLPGVRHAFNFHDESQLVVGLGAPIRFIEGKPDYGVMFFMSFEHKFLR